jgi:hypothetical protein
VLFGLAGSVYDWNDPFGRLFLTFARSGRALAVMGKKFDSPSEPDPVAWRVELVGAGDDLLASHGMVGLSWRCTRSPKT